MDKRRNMNAPFDDTCRFKKADAASFEIVDHLVWQNKYSVYNDRLYYYREDLGAHILIDRKDEWYNVSKCLDDCIATKLKPSQIKNLLEMIHFDPRLRSKIEFDSYPNLINLKNGVIDITHLNLMPHDCKYGFTSCINAEYIHGASINDAPVFKKFCYTSLNGDPAKIKLQLESLGYVISGYICAKKAFFFVGKPNSGKSQILIFICDIIGENHVSNVAFDKLGSRFNIAELSRSKVNINAEIPLEPIKDLSIFKSLVGGDRIQAEEKGKPPFSFYNKARLVFAGNGLPVIKSQDTTEAFVSRLVVLYFPNSISDEDRILNLSDKLYAERNIIVSLAINALKELVENGFKFELPKEEKDLLIDYKQNSAHINNFLDDMCCYSPEYKTSTKKLYEAYVKYCSENCYMPFNMQTATISMRNIKNLKSIRLCVKDSNNKSIQRRGLQGIALKAAINEEQDSESEYKNDTERAKNPENSDSGVKSDYDDYGTGGRMQ